MSDENGLPQTKRCFVYPLGKRRKRGGPRESNLSVGQLSTIDVRRHGETPSQCLPEDDINPFINPDDEAEPPSKPLTGDRQNAVTLQPEGSETRKKHPMRLNRRAWETPGPSPLSQVSDDLPVGNGDPYMRFPAADRMPGEGEEPPAFHFHFPSPHSRPLNILPLPRTLAGKRKGRVSTSVWRSYLTHVFLSRIYVLGVESPELDLVDEYGIDFLLDLQADLRRGLVSFPRLSTYNLGRPSALGTPRRRLVWRTGQTFPRRLEDYGRAAARLLARKRSSEAAQESGGM
ncbi:hypothetical protein C8Q80DRAFT_1270004 [Daedaleopsis nitida]|nr:hypothetical protein C8Q80DRAFT_1270004 [Daedaleopsis nitida]